MATFIKAGFWDKLCKPCKGYKGWLNLDELIQSFIPKPTYKVYTALLTQSGGDNVQALAFGDSFTVGVTYNINIPVADLMFDFTNIGAPNNEIGTSFVATGTTPNTWGIDLGYSGPSYNTGAPVVTVLENTIGNIWFRYDNFGVYSTLSDDLFTENKTIISFMPSIYIESSSDIYNFTGYPNGVNMITLTSFYNYNQANDQFGGYAQTAIEIRVYN